MRLTLLATAVFAVGMTSSAMAQDSTHTKQHRDSLHRDSLLHRRHGTTSPGDVLDTNVSRNLPKRDTAAIQAPTRQDTSKLRHEMRRDTSSVEPDTAVRPKPPR